MSFSQSKACMEPNKATKIPSQSNKIDAKVKYPLPQKKQVVTLPKLSHFSSDFLSVYLS